MLSMSAEALEAVQYGYTMRVRAESWLDGVLLADNIPVSGGGEAWDASMNVPASITLTAPAEDDDGNIWDPVDTTSPLAAYGQLLRIDFGVDIEADTTEWINHGWFLITNSSSSQGTVTVSAADLLALISEARFVAPFQPTGTFASTLSDLIEPALTADIDGLLTDRAVPAGMQWDDGRLGALNEVLNTWPAAARVNEDGYLAVTEPPDYTGDPVLDLSDTGDGATVTWYESSTTRDGAFNVVVAQGSDSSGNQIQGTFYDEDGLSPYRIGGPFNPLPVPYFYYSPLLTTVDECRKAAQTTMVRLRRAAARSISFRGVPHPGLRLDDIVTVTSSKYGLTKARGVIDKYNLPYNPGEMTGTVRLL